MLQGDSGIQGEANPRALHGDEPPARRRRIARPRDEGQLRIFYILASCVGLGSEFYPAIAWTPRIQHLVAISSGNWQLFTSAEADSHPEKRIFDKAARATRALVFGYIAYVVQSVAVFPYPIPCPDMSLEALQVQCASPIHGRLASDIIREWRESDGASGSVPICVAPNVAVQITCERSVILHIIPITARTPRADMLHNEPSKYITHRFIESQHVAMPRRQRAGNLVLQRLDNNFHGATAEEILEWVDASKYIKQVRKSWLAGKAFAKILCRRGPETLQAMISRVTPVCYDTLRRARVRTDVVAMLIWRHVFASTLASEHALYLWTDSSPQWRARELFAATFESFTPTRYARKMFPHVTHQLGLDTLAKVLALLWQIWLVSGPAFRAVRSFCDRVHCIVTDYGTERHICDHVDILPEFFRMIGCRTDYSPQLQTYLFPRAMSIGGWRHTFDLILRRSLGQLSFFPGWMDKFKVYVAPAPTHCQLAMCLFVGADLARYVCSVLFGFRIVR
jgi:hypothetical protein